MPSSKAAKRRVRSHNLREQHARIQTQIDDYSNCVRGASLDGLLHRMRSLEVLVNALSSLVVDVHWGMKGQWTHYTHDGMVGPNVVDLVDSFPQPGHYDPTTCCESAGKDGLRVDAPEFVPSFVKVPTSSVGDTSLEPPSARTPESGPRFKTPPKPGSLEHIPVADVLSQMVTVIDPMGRRPGSGETAQCSYDACGTLGNGSALLGIGTVESGHALLHKLPIDEQIVECARFYTLPSVGTWLLTPTPQSICTARRRKRFCQSFSSRHWGDEQQLEFSGSMLGALLYTEFPTMKLEEVWKQYARKIPSVRREIFSNLLYWRCCARDRAEHEQLEHRIWTHYEELG